MPTLPIVPVTIPTRLAGQSNGRLPSSILVDTPGQAGGATVRLVEPAARAWRAMTAEALARGHVLKPTSLFDSYRPYDIQRRIFLQRYTQEPNGTTPRLWDSDGDGVREKWYLQPGNAPAAVPGTSNHGLGIAVDVGEERDQDTGAESMDALTLQWLANNELRFGFSHELAVEPWHVRYWAGDNIPAAVLAYEEDQMAFTEDDAKLNARVLLQTLLGSSGPNVGVALQSTHGNVVTLLGRPPVESAPVDPAALKAVMLDPEVMAAYAKAVNDDAARRAAE